MPLSRAQDHVSSENNNGSFLTFRAENGKSDSKMLVFPDGMQGIMQYYKHTLWANPLNDSQPVRVSQTTNFMCTEDEHCPLCKLGHKSDLVYVSRVLVRESTEDGKVWTPYVYEFKRTVFKALTSALEIEKGFDEENGDIDKMIFNIKRNPVRGPQAWEASSTGRRIENDDIPEQIEIDLEEIIKEMTVEEIQNKLNEIVTSSEDDEI